MLKSYFENELVKLGYSDEMSIEYSLSYRQGDGVAFYGKQSTENVCDLLERLMISNANAKDAGSAVDRVTRLMRKKDVNCMINVIRESDIGYVTIQRNSYGNHYSHWNTMTVDHEMYFSYLLENPTVTENETGVLVDTETIERWEMYWAEFIELLQGDVRETSRKLERDGYAMIDSVCHKEEAVWERKTSNFTVTIYELETSLDDAFYMGDYDSENIAEFCTLLLEGKHRLVTVKAVVEHRASAKIIGTHQYDAILCEVGDTTYGGARRDILVEAIGEARDSISALSGSTKKKAA